MPPHPLPDELLRPLVEAALHEDLGTAGDITTKSTIPENTLWKAKLATRKPGIVAGLDLARIAFLTVDPTVVFTPTKKDGSLIAAGDCLAVIEGKARSLLSAERVALNFLCHLSGIATETHKFVEAVKPHKTHIRCSRKTTPGLRALEKYAVRAGGGENHRFGLYDAVLIKDNHIAAAGGIRQAIESACRQVVSVIEVEIEVDNLAQLDEILSLLPTLPRPIDGVLLDNMDVPTLKLAVEKVGGRFKTEASGGVTLASVAVIAATGVDRIAVGAITHSAPILDIGLDNF